MKTRSTDPSLHATATLVMYQPPAGGATWGARAWCALSGLLAAAALTQEPLHPLIWVALSPWLATLYAGRPVGVQRAVSASLWFGVPLWLGFFAFFMALHPLTWVGIDWWVSLALAVGGWLTLGFYHGLGPAAVGAALGWMEPVGWRRVAAPAAAWVVMEWALQWGFLGVPMGRLPVALADQPAMLQLLPYTGGWGASALVVAVNAALAVGWLALRGGRPGRAGAALALAAALAGGNYLFGRWQIDQARAGDGGSGEPFGVAVVQGNTKVNEKWVQGKLEQVVRTHKQLTWAAARAHPGTRLVVWPETSLPLYIHDYPYYYQQLQRLATDLRVALYVGVLERRPEGLYNAVLALDDRGAERGMYFKRHLVPFGEYLPGRQWMPAFLREINKAGADLAAGTEPALVTFPFARVGTLICFESPYAYLARDTMLAGAELLVIVTNDSWYKRTPLLPIHHAHAVLRAVESRRYVVRAANTGISSLVTPWGEVRDRSPIQVATELGGLVYPRREITPYIRWGDWLVWLAAGLCGWWMARHGRGARTP